MEVLRCSGVLLAGAAVAVISTGMRVRGNLIQETNLQVNTVENTNDFGRASTLYHQEQVWIRNRKTVLGSTSGTRIERDMAGRVNEDDVQSRVYDQQ